uniref:AARP2CN domain-containing protein n=1 Tax=Anolis carolinensis TaxID=28377 RepID=H9G4B5_ANOCA
QAASLPRPSASSNAAHWPSWTARTGPGSSASTLSSQVLEEKRNLGRKDGPPHLVVVVPLHASVAAQSALGLFQSDGASAVCRTEGGPQGYALLCPRFKLRWRFVVADTGNLHTVLDLAKVADTLLFLLDPTEGWDAAGDLCLAVQGLSGQPPKKQSECRKKLSKATEKRFPGARLFALDTEQESASLLQHLAGQKQRHLAFRDRRPHLMAEAAQFVPGPESPSVGTLKVSGYLRGRRLNVNAVVHIAGHGDFLMSQMDAPPEPFALNPRVTKGPPRICNTAEMEVLSKADPSKQEPLQAEAVPDPPMEGEQTWPTEEELKEAQGQ